jgi:predicted DNA-binding transcriptional regulator
MRSFAPLTHKSASSAVKIYATLIHRSADVGVHLIAREMMSHKRSRSENFAAVLRGFLYFLESTPVLFLPT